VHDAAELSQRLIEYCDDPDRAREVGARGQHVVEQGRGAVDRLVAMVVPLLSPSA